MLISKRFNGLEIVLTIHAQQRAQERNINDQIILDIIDNGEQKEASPGHYWFFKYYPERDDNLLCIAAVVDNAIIIKTVMHHWRPAP